MTTEPQVTGKETKVRRSQVTCSRSHSWSGLGQDNAQGSAAPSSSSSLSQKHVSPHASHHPQLRGIRLVSFRENRLLTLILLQGRIEGIFQHGFSRFYLALHLREVKTFRLPWQQRAGACKLISCGVPIPSP